MVAAVATRLQLGKAHGLDKITNNMLKGWTCAEDVHFGMFSTLRMGNEDPWGLICRGRPFRFRESVSM
eukprot:11213554-Lingulodinium_polyedra.AAC.1